MASLLAGVGQLSQMAKLWAKQRHNTVTMTLLDVCKQKKTSGQSNTTINTRDEFRNVSVTEVGVAGWAWSTHA